MRVPTCSTLFHAKPGRTRPCWMLAAIFADLIRTLQLRILRVGLQPRKRPLLDPLRGEGEGHGGDPVR